MEDKRKKYLDIVTNIVFDGTRMDGEYRIIFPFKKFVFPGKPEHLNNKRMDDNLYADFYGYCEENFGLTNSEINNVWDEYKFLFLHTF